jgi:hypothetical protein
MKHYHDEPALPIWVLVLVLIISLLLAQWWLPQKWEACKKLYDNQSARVYCMAAR